MEGHPVIQAAKKAKLFRLLGQRWMTQDDSTRLCHLRTISQRVSEWRAEGHCIIDKWVVTPGARFKAYKLVKPSSWTA